MNNNYNINLTKDQAIATAEKMNNLANRLYDNLNNAKSNIHSVLARTSNVQFMQNFTERFDGLNNTSVNIMVDKIRKLAEQIKQTAILQEQESKNEIK